MILFVDDELLRIDPILATFENAGIEFKAVENGIECISFLESNLEKVELIIVDLMIPYGEKSVRDMYPGIELIADIQKIKRNVPIIVYTNVASDKINDFLRGLDVKRIVRKSDAAPLDLVRMVNEYISINKNNS